MTKKSSSKKQLDAAIEQAKPSPLNMTKKSSSKKQLDAAIEQAKPSPLNMPKKSSKKPIQKQENADVEQAKTSSTPMKASDEIDEIFSAKKRKKPEQKKVDKANVNGEEKPKLTTKKKKKSKEDEEGRFTDPHSRSRKKTEDGLNIYTEEELGFSKSSGGGTALCPFDCDCCF